MWTLRKVLNKNVFWKEIQFVFNAENQQKMKFWTFSKKSVLWLTPDRLYSMP